MAAEVQEVPGPFLHTLANLNTSQQEALQGLRAKVEEVARSAGTEGAHPVAGVLRALLDESIAPAEGEGPQAVGGLPDWRLLQFLVARQFQVDAAFEMLSVASQWRAENRPVERLIGHESQLIENQRMKAVWYSERDLFGRPVCLGWAGRHLKYWPSLQEKIDHALWCIESGSRRCTAVDGPASYFVVIADLSDLGMDNVDYPFFQEMINLLQSYYPERLGAFYICNAGWLFSVVWKIVKPWLDKRTAQKIFVNPSKEDLARIMPREQLPRSFGGLADDSPFGKEIPADAPKPPKK